MFDDDLRWVQHHLQSSPGKNAVMHFKKLNTYSCGNAFRINKQVHDPYSTEIQQGSFVAASSVCLMIDKTCGMGCGGP